MDVSSINIRSVEEIPEKYRNIFAQFTSFNRVQSIVFDDVVRTDENLVISAPTGSGKTVVLELAIIRLLSNLGYDQNQPHTHDFKIIYLAPVKVLCEEKFRDWCVKFQQLHNVQCLLLTGDIDSKDVSVKELVAQSHIICTTPEKWQASSRNWKSNDALLKAIKLCLVDEVHFVGDTSRGSVLENVISRLKRQALVSDVCNGPSYSSLVRFIAVSATIPNIVDFCVWLGVGPTQPAKCLALNDDSFRPVKLEKLVIGCYETNMCEKLPELIRRYSDGKPTLIFCPLRKYTTEGAEWLAKRDDFAAIENKAHLREQTSKFDDKKLADAVVRGVGYHHAGVDWKDRLTIQTLFYEGYLPILLSTSTLAIGVNLPAHLVIIKSTIYYRNHSWTNLSHIELSQMIGRAGRPQFDTSATAIVLTRPQDVTLYEDMVNGAQIKSCLRKALVEQLNCEIASGSVTSVSSAVIWLQSTFLFARLSRDPSLCTSRGCIEVSPLKLTSTDESRHQKVGKTFNDVDNLLRKLVDDGVRRLLESQMIVSADGADDCKERELSCTYAGKLMAWHGLDLATMTSLMASTRFVKDTDDSVRFVQSDIALNQLLYLICDCKQMDHVRMLKDEVELIDRAQTRFLLSSVSPDTVINFPAAKAFVIIQLTLDGQCPKELRSDVGPIIRTALNILECLLKHLLSAWREGQSSRSLNIYGSSYETFINSCILLQCLSAKKWHDAPVDPKVDRQKLPEIAITFAQLGDVSDSTTVVDICCEMRNVDFLKTIDGGHLGYNIKSRSVFLIGDEHGALLHAEFLCNGQFIYNNGRVIKKRLVLSLGEKGRRLRASFIFLYFAGLDVNASFDLTCIPEAKMKRHLSSFSIDDSKKNRAD